MRAQECALNYPGLPDTCLDRFAIASTLPVIGEETMARAWIDLELREPNACGAIHEFILRLTKTIGHSGLVHDTQTRLAARASGAYP
jgi:hypothetical protein